MTVTPVGAVTSESVTEASIEPLPRIASIWVVALPALAALSVPGKTCASLVSITP